MEAMAMMANLQLSEKAIRKQIASAVTLVLQVARLSDGTRHLTHITEITGMEGEIITLQDLFVYEKGIFSAMGIRPKFAERLRANGITLPADLFETTSRRWG
jgi:pilus assembly protein CpaF